MNVLNIASIQHKYNTQQVQAQSTGGRSSFAQALEEAQGAQTVTPAKTTRPNHNYPASFGWETRDGIHRFYNGSSVVKEMPVFENNDSLAGDDLFAAIVKHYNGGSVEFFPMMIGKLERAELITHEQSVRIFSEFMYKTEQFINPHVNSPHGLGVDLQKLLIKHLLSQDNLLLGLMDLFKSDPEIQRVLSNIRDIMSAQNNNQGGNSGNH